MCTYVHMCVRVCLRELKSRKLSQRIRKKKENRGNRKSKGGRERDRRCQRWWRRRQKIEGRCEKVTEETSRQRDEQTDTGTHILYNTKRESERYMTYTHIYRGKEREKSKEREERGTDGLRTDRELETLFIVTYVHI